MGHGEVDIVNATTTVPAPINNYDSLLRHAMQLCESLGVKAEDIRGFGLSLRDLKPRVGTGKCQKYNPLAISYFYSAILWLLQRVFQYNNTEE